MAHYDKERQKELEQPVLTEAEKQAFRLIFGEWPDEQRSYDNEKK